MGPAASRPSGAVTFAFTDIEGSTVRWDRDHAAMQDAVRRHDAIVRAAIVDRGGHIFKTMGDSFCAAFTRSDDAVAAMLAAQRALAAEDFSAVDGLRVRIALHAGAAHERDGDYFGPDVNRVARLLAVGHGGQVLLSGACTESIGDDLPAECTLRDLGEHRLKDLARSERIFQLVAPQLASDFPPLRSLEHLSNNLPAHVSSFIGRVTELADVAALLREHRLLTLVGSGGVGKTRLSLQVAADFVDRFRDGVWFVDLAPLTMADYIPTTVARTLDLTLPSDGDLIEHLSRSLKGKTLLLVFDNCEHLVEGAARVISAILQGAPNVKVLASSRQPLGIAGEATYHVPSLDSDTSVALFVERAKAVNGKFGLTEENSPLVTTICNRLDGIALAIELAAARVRVLSIPNLARRLDERFKLLTGGGRDRLPRQQTLRALIDWSYDLLAPREQILFNRLGIFAGGFTLHAAGVVCSSEEIDAAEILELIESLTDKSLIVADTTGAHERFYLLESTSAYAIEKLAAVGENESLARRHAEYFHNEAEKAEKREEQGSSRATWLATIEPDLSNYRAVLEWSLKNRHDEALGRGVVAALRSFWFHRGFAAEGRDWIGLAQSGLDESGHPRVAAQLWGALTVLSSGKKTQEYAQRALALYGLAGDDKGHAWALRRFASGLFQQGQLEEARDASARALAAARSIGDESGIADGLNQAALIECALGDFSAARELFSQALAAFNALKNEVGTVFILGNLAELAFAVGEVREALRLADEALAIQIRGKNSLSLAACYLNITVYRIALGDMDGARETAREGLRLSVDAQYPQFVAGALQHIALLLARGGQPNDAARLVGYVDLQFKDLGIRREATEKWGYENLMSALREQLSDAEIEELAAQGCAWPEDHAVAEALKI